MTGDLPHALPVHGFVLAGGKSRRMGRDKALLQFRGQTMVERVAGKLRAVCPEVSLAGNRADLDRIAPVVPETRVDAGPAAGLEAGLAAASQPWAMFVPVDVPLVPETLLRHWAGAVVQRETAGVRLSFLRTGAGSQAAFCMLHVSCRGPLSAALDAGERKLERLFGAIAEALGPDALWVAEVEQLAGAAGATAGAVDVWFRNVNTPEDLEAAENSWTQGNEAR